MKTITLIVDNEESYLLQRSITEYIRALESVRDSTINKQIQGMCDSAQTVLYRLWHKINGACNETQN